MAHMGPAGKKFGIVTIMKKVQVMFGNSRKIRYHSPDVQAPLTVFGFRGNALQVF